MTGSTAAAINRALGAYGEALAARHLSSRAWSCSTATGGVSAGEIDLVLRDGRVLVVCEVKTRSSVDLRHPHEAVTADQAGPAGRLGDALAGRATACSRTDLRIDLVGVLRPRAGPSTIDHVRGVV